MNFQKIFVPIAGAAAVAMAYRVYGWAGVAVVATVVVMWVLLHFTRMMQVLKRAADRPVGYVDSAVMLNAKLRAGHTLLHVLAMTRSLGARQSEKDVQPEVFRWTDGSQSHVTCTFVGGKLASHVLFRPALPDPVPATDGSSDAP
ncbi:MAG: glycerate kinase [Polaromonas sp.]|uniref:glycerate kinase n=1 Tax=Polaromonas sp. TaxID=1869339 RepID=UPI0027372718|nr:glycerate kinase [Polaromonas sp.]MDP1956184.1 glycerate kinase [Polaromonas sp.]MDP3247320.1 glycerate kinase [Polaromonas sp.]MDP3752748.1 glycerate kinase [Polaromonas sp.]